MRRRADTLVLCANVLWSACAIASADLIETTNRGIRDGEHYRVWRSKQQVKAANQYSGHEFVDLTAMQLCKSS